MAARRTWRLALDWTPNTNHTGFYVARAQGLCNIEFVLPEDAAAEGMTPARLVAAGKADFAIAPSETAVSFATSESSKPRLQAVAAVLQGSTSAIATLKSSGIDTPAMLAGKRYASYVGRFEDAIVAQMVTNSGGDGTAVDFHPLPAHAYGDEDTMNAGSVVASMLEKGLSDSTWIFSHWEGVLAERSGQELNYFALEDFGVPYGYSPVLLAHPDLLGSEAEAVKAFLAASAKGFAYAAAEPQAAAEILCKEAAHPSLADAEFVAASQKMIAPKYLTEEGKWGVMAPGRWTKFVDFLGDSHILVSRGGKPIDRSAVDDAGLFTNEFLP